MVPDNSLLQGHCPLHWQTFCIVFGLYPLHASSFPPVTPDIVKHLEMQSQLLIESQTTQSMWCLLEKGLVLSRWGFGCLVIWSTWRFISVCFSSCKTRKILSTITLSEKKNKICKLHALVKSRSQSVLFLFNLMIYNLQVRNYLYLCCLENQMESRRLNNFLRAAFFLKDRNKGWGLPEVF